MTRFSIFSVNRFSIISNEEPKNYREIARMLDINTGLESSKDTVAESVKYLCNIILQSTEMVAAISQIINHHQPSINCVPLR